MRCIGSKALKSTISSFVQSRRWCVRQLIDDRPKSKSEPIAVALSSIQTKLTESERCRRYLIEQAKKRTRRSG
jgi:hypothetical protein